jgi:uncharacterized membrane protein (DUF2068 family)
VPPPRREDQGAPRAARGTAGDRAAEPARQPRRLPLRRRLKEGLKEGLRVVALFEALKGTLALLAAGGLFYSIPRDFRHVAEELVGRLHLNAGKSYPNVFNRIIEDTTNAQLWMIGALVLVYAVVRFSEAYGLWRERRWAEWLAALSGGVYVPVEIYELTRGVSWIKLVALALNLCVVAYMCYVLRRTRTSSPPG